MNFFHKESKSKKTLESSDFLAFSGRVSRALWFGILINKVGK